MNMKTWLSLALAVCMALTLAACGSEDTAVYVQSVASISGTGIIAPGDRFAGVVVSENVTQVQKDSDKSVAELLVKAGQDVTEGQALFSYDTEELQLNLDKQKLELEQLQAMIENYQEQIADLEKERDQVYSGDQLQYTIQIQSLQVDLKEAELNLEAKQTAITQSEGILENAVVYAPVAGRIQSINESGMDSYGNPAAYITIQQTGSFRVQGSLGELQLGGIQEGTRMRIISRTDPDVFWLGTVSLIDFENPSQNDDYYGGIVYGGANSSISLTSASSYPFYVELDSTEGLVLGQHIYMELDTEEAGGSGLQLTGAFVCYDEDGSAYVWADKGGKLEKRAVTLGDYNTMLDAYEITEGLTESDYIAFPDEELCFEGAPTTREGPVTDNGDSNTPADLPAVEGGVG